MQHLLVVFGTGYLLKFLFLSCIEFPSFFLSSQNRFNCFPSEPLGSTNLPERKIKLPVENLNLSCGVACLFTISLQITINLKIFLIMTNLLRFCVRTLLTLFHLIISNGICFPSFCNSCFNYDSIRLCFWRLIFKSNYSMINLTR